jgi:hypothetical protein
MHSTSQQDWLCLHRAPHSPPSIFFAFFSALRHQGRWVSMMSSQVQTMRVQAFAPAANAKCFAKGSVPAAFAGLKKANLLHGAQMEPLFFKVICQATVVRVAGLCPILP